MKQKQNVVDSVTLNTNQPTDISFQELYTWVIWQFPRKKADGLCGAVRPPIANHDWFPAIIYAEEERVQIFAHLDKLFSTPEEAADFIHKRKVR
jgi:hypothetical protein